MDILLFARVVSLMVIAAEPAPHAASTRGKALPACSAWLSKTLRTVEATPTLRQRDFIIAAVGRACEGVPAPLRKGAKAYAKARGEARKARILTDAAVEVLKGSCEVSDPLASAAALVEKCPLPGPGEKAAPSVYRWMRSADYVFVDALMTGLIAANAYDDTAYRIVLEFIVSSAQSGEARKSSQRH
jgi:hypothetical protein